MFFNDEGPRAKSRLKDLRSGASALCTVMAAATAIPTGLYIYNSFAVDGAEPVEALLAGLLGGALFGGIVTLHNWGIYGISAMSRSARSVALPVYAIGAVLMGGISATASIAYVAGPGAEKAALERAVDETAEDRAALQAAIGYAQTTRQVIGNASLVSNTLFNAENASGGICLTGRNQGPCTSALESVTRSLSQADAEINESLAAIEPLMRRAAEHQNEIEGIAGSERVSEGRRLAQVQEETTALSEVLRDIRAALPIDAMEVARATLGRDFTTFGLPAAGAERMNAELRPFGVLVQASIDAIAEATREPPYQAEKLSPLELVGQEWASVGLLAAALAMLDILPLLIVALVIVSTPPPPTPTPTRDEHLEPDDPSGTVSQMPKRRVSV